MDKNKSRLSPWLQCRINVSIRCNSIAVRQASGPMPSCMRTKLNSDSLHARSCSGLGGSGELEVDKKKRKKEENRLSLGRQCRVNTPCAYLQFVEHQALCPSCMRTYHPHSAHEVVQVLAVVERWMEKKRSSYHYGVRPRSKATITS